MYPRRGKTDWVAFRIVLVAVCFALATGLLVIRAYRLQVGDAESLKQRAAKQRTKVLHLEARRGMIMDRSGEQLAASLEVDSICAAPRRITNTVKTARALAEILEMKEAEIIRRLNEDRAFVWIRRRVSPLLADRVKRADLEGVFSVTEYARFYPLKTLAAHAIGVAGIDSKGLEGLELFYDQDLKAEPVPVIAQRDARGKPLMFAAATNTPVRRDLHLTIDRNIQYIAEKEVEEALRREQAAGALCVVMDADSGEILALAIRPSFNLNLFHKVSADVRRNRAVNDTFEPGSTFKVFMAAAALDLGKVSLEDRFYCHKGLLRYKGAEIHDVVPHDWLYFDEILIHSSNIGAVKVSERLSNSEFFGVLQGFGFGAPTGIDLPGERSGVLPIPGRWSALTKPNLAFGQGLAVNAVQLTAAFAAAINGGILYKPYLMKRMTNAFGQTLVENRPVPVRRVIKSSTSAQLVEILREAVNKGTGKAAGVSGVEVIGKTGTAQKAAAGGGYSEEKYVSSFVGALMGMRPRLAIFVMIDEPAGKQRTGGKVAAPVFRKIAEGIQALCGSKPSEIGLVLASAGIRLPTGERERAEAVKVRRGPREGEWIIPDLAGLNMRQVLDVCGRIKCDASFRGTGQAVGQHPKPGDIFKEGALLEVSFKGQSS